MEGQQRLCHVCSKPFRNAKALGAHIKAHLLPTPIYQCDTCKKVFGSGQALGGHQTSHRKAKKQLEGEEMSLVEKQKKIITGNKNVVNPKHFLGSSSTSTSPIKQLPGQNGEYSDTETRNENFRISFIDLNFPPPMEYEE